MEAALGASYASSWAHQQAITALGGRTPMEALEAGVDPQQVWRAVHAALDLPSRDR
ncbi:hypothetical protein AFL01nite_22950 [Aeromicrobium flavum]|uniref:DUF3046 domain-containing protein n=2 Tax=Aeromicrobium flavum TaxID=416568 RepID=A0A512HWZ3_9ACTN|nr:hypothetical protein AFL01nite_22950 [Aeromicrobium flavum]